MSHLPSERLAIVEVIDPEAMTAGTTAGDAIDMSVHDQVMFIVMTGNLGASGTVDFQVKESSESGGTYHKISGKSITQMTEATSTRYDSQAVVNVKASELAVDHRYIKGYLAIGTATSDVAVLALASNSRFSDAVYTTTYGDLASVVEIVA